MGVPRRFAIEYAERCLQLMDHLKDFAKEADLVGSFSLLVAGTVLTMPYERMKAGHFLHQPEDGDLSEALKLLRKTTFRNAPFWRDEPPEGWRQARLLGEVRDAHVWRDTKGRHPFSHGAENSIGRRSTDEVIRVIRNALSHGNVVYLNKYGFDVPGEQMCFLGFLCEYEQENAIEGAIPQYRLVAAPEPEFFRLVNDWAHWISQFERGR